MATPRVERIGLAEMWLGDCREVLSTLTRCDVVITDPVWPNCPTGLLTGSDRPQELFAEAMVLLPSSVQRVVVILRNDSDPRFLAALGPQWRFFAAHWLPYAMPSFIGRKLGGSEVAYSFGEPIPARPGRQLVPSWAPKAQPSKRDGMGHPCSRALSHMRWLVEWWSDLGEKVLDPFAGSGTIGAAAVALGRRYVGIEIEERWFDLACHRIEEAQRQGRLDLGEVA